MVVALTNLHGIGPGECFGSSSYYVVPDLEAVSRSMRCGNSPGDDYGCMAGGAAGSIQMEAEVAGRLQREPLWVVGDSHCGMAVLQGG